MSELRTRRGVNLEPARARRGVDCEILCGACDHVIASRRRKVLVFLQPRLHGPLQKLPATVDCPFCHVPNLLDPKQLNVSELQTDAGPQHSGRGPAIGLHIL